MGGGVDKACTESGAVDKECKRKGDEQCTAQRSSRNQKEKRVDKK